MKHKNHNASTSNQKEHDEASNENVVKNGINKKMQSEAKRLQSLKHMIKGYHAQKSLIKAALANVDSVPKNKIIFDDDDDEPNEENHVASKKTSTDLFGSDDDGSDVDDLKVDEKFESATTKQMWDFQKKFQNDERFKLNKKGFFKDKEDDKPIDSVEGESSLEDEKQKQFQILEQVLGSKVKSKSKNESNVQPKGMSRFDPSQPESKNYEIDNTQLSNENTEVAKKKKKEKLQKEVEVVKPVVSTETFYKVSEDLLNFNWGGQYSLLSTYGATTDDKEHKEKEPYQVEVTKSASGEASGHESNPFRYDSSADEEKEETESSRNKVEITNNKVATGQSLTLFSEPFFFKDDDYRLQEGLDFMKRVEAEGQEEFGKLRRDLKKIVKAKVKNNQKKNKPFKKKLGGNKRKKLIKIKKALKR